MLGQGFGAKSKLVMLLNKLSFHVSRRMYGAGVVTRTKRARNGSTRTPTVNNYCSLAYFVTFNAYSQRHTSSYILVFPVCIVAANPVKDIKKQQDVAIRLKGLANVVEVACGSSFNLVRCASH